MVMADQASTPSTASPVQPFLLYVRYPNGSIQIMRFETAFARGLVCVTLGPQPVDLRIEDLREGE